MLYIKKVDFVDVNFIYIKKKIHQSNGKQNVMQIHSLSLTFIL